MRIEEHILSIKNLVDVAVICEIVNDKRGYCNYIGKANMEYAILALEHPEVNLETVKIITGLAKE